MGRAGRPRLQRRHPGRRLPRPQRPASSSVRRLRGRPGRLLVRSRRGAARRPRRGTPRSTRTGPDDLRGPRVRVPGGRADQGVARDARALQHLDLARAAPAAGLGAGGRAGSRAQPAAGRVRLHPRGADCGPAVDGVVGQGAGLVDGRRHRARRPLRDPARRGVVPQAALRTGHQPGDRPPARARGDVAAHPARHARATAHRAARGGARHRAQRLPADAGRSRRPPRRRRGHRPLRAARRDVPAQRRAGRPGERADPALLRGGVGGARRRGAGRPRRQRRDTGPRSCADAARGRRRPPAPDRVPAAIARLDRRRLRGAARHPSLRDLARVRRRGDLPTGRAGDGRRAGHQERLVSGRAAGRLPARDRGRRAEGDVEDGHLLPRLLPRRADLRCRRAGSRRDRPVLHRHGVAGRGHRLPRAGRGRHRAARGGVRAEAGARQPGLREVAARRRVPRQQPGRDPAAARRRAARRADASARGVEGPARRHDGAGDPHARPRR